MKQILSFVCSTNIPISHCIHCLFYALSPFYTQHVWVYVAAPHCNFNFYFNCYYWLLLALGSLMFYMFGCVWQPSINEHDDDRNKYLKGSKMQTCQLMGKSSKLFPVSSQSPSTSFTEVPHFLEKKSYWETNLNIQTNNINTEITLKRKIWLNL